MRALVTGGGSPLAQAIASDLADQGHHVVLQIRKHHPSSEQLSDRIGLLVHDFEPAADNTTEFLAKASALLGGEPSIFIDTIGNYLQKPLADLTDLEFAELIYSNLSRPFGLLQALVPSMVQSGSGQVVLFGYSPAVDRGRSRSAILPYQIAKLGLSELVRAYAADYAAAGLQFNVLAPGVIENTKYPTEYLLPAGRKASIEEIASGVKYLLASPYINGTELVIDGAWRARI